VSALVTAALGTTLIVTKTGAGNAHANSPGIHSVSVKTTAISAAAKSTATTAVYRNSPTIDQQLQTLADTVKRAARH
jgi:hypothetical protein